MSESSQITAVLDTNVLFPPVLRDTLLYAAAFRLFRPVWSAQTWEELARNLVAKGGLSEPAAVRRMSFMTQAFPYAMAVPPPELIAALKNHPKDRHVLAAAIQSGAGIIVTQNLKDFPAEVVTEHGIAALHADAFLCSLLRTDAERLLRSIHHHAARLRHPPMAASDLLSALSRHAPGFVRAAAPLLAGDDPGSGAGGVSGGP